MERPVVERPHERAGAREPRWREAVIVVGLAGVLGLGVFGHGTLHHADRPDSFAPYCEITGSSPGRANVGG